MVFKSLNGLTPDYLSSKFIALSNTTSYTCRDSLNELTLFLNTNEIPGELHLLMSKYYLLLNGYIISRAFHIKKLLK